MRDSCKRYGSILAIFLALFVLRVVAQLVQAVSPVTFLPPFNAWHSGALPYPWLVIAQLIVIAACIKSALSVYSGRVQPRKKVGKIYLVFGAIYLCAMLFRAVAGSSFAEGHPWFGARLPTIFHLVLASFVLTLGAYHFRDTKKIIAVAVYPATLILVVCTHLFALQNQINLLVATYVPVAIGALVIIVLEKYFPYRNAWKPNRKDAFNDVAYMAIVQVALPKCLGFVLSVVALAFAGEFDLSLDFWPHDWPVLVQMVMMLICAEFFRYWLHRLAHEWKPMWRLHAVHHSSDKLYWMNVARFHPLEKTLQYLFDALPFIALGVSPQVLSLYFVCYAVNGFFQHCNSEVRLGFLNYLISGPELHRWHHSKFIQESNHNYGNNLIVWDFLFGTWFKPESAIVAELGLINQKYPRNFLAQLRAPFATDLDKSS